MSVQGRRHSIDVFAASHSARQLRPPAGIVGEAATAPRAVRQGRRGIARISAMHDLRVVPADAVGRAHVRPSAEWAGSSVPAGHRVETGYVSIHDVVCHAPYGHQLYPAEVERAYRRQLELGGEQDWPPPTGYWRNDRRFVLTDGRNRFTAALMLGIEYLLVAWLVPPDEE